MKVRFITSLREFDALAPIWQEITRASGQTSPFVSHDWFACCWRAAGPNRHREVWLLEDAAGPVALIPLVKLRSRTRGLSVRTIRLLDSPDTPFVDFPVARGIDEVMSVFLDSLRQRRDWDVFSISKLPIHSMLYKVLEATLPGQFPWRIAGREQSPHLAISGTWDDFLRQKSPRFRKTFRNVENRMDRSGKVAIEEHREVDPDGPAFADALEVSHQSWKGPSGVAMATMEGMPRFFRELTRRASANGWLHLWMLRLDGRPIATEYQIGAGGSLHALRADFDAAFADLSPGAFLNGCIVKTLFQRRTVHEYDMGPGTNEYKLRWASGTHEAVGMEINAPTPYGRLLHKVETCLVPAARRWRDRLGQACG